MRVRFAMLLFMIISMSRLCPAADRIIGAPAPDFAMADLASPGQHRYFQLSRNFSPDSGHAVAICFFASWCGLCLEEMKLIKSLTDSLYKGKLTMVAVSVEKEYGPRQKIFVRQAGLECSVLLDTQRVVANLYRMKPRLPYTVLINKKGIVGATVSGYSPRAERYIYLALEKMMKVE